MANIQRKDRDTSCDLKFRQQELIVKMTKEIMIKFIEVGKVTPDSFGEVFEAVYKTVASVISGL